MKTEYDSTADTLNHIMLVRDIIEDFIKELLDRCKYHDYSKLLPPEKETFDEYTPKLKDLIYGSDGYKECLKKMKPAIEHHNRKNRHHPEHFENGIKGMTLIDLIEMLADWKAAGKRHRDGGDIEESIRINKTRFLISPTLEQILINTAKTMI